MDVVYWDDTTRHGICNRWNTDRGTADSFDEVIEMGLFTSMVGIILFAGCGFFTYQGYVQSEPAAAFVGAVGMVLVLLLSSLK